MKHRTVFISDVHLGSRHSKTACLLEFLRTLKQEPPEKVYLIGDIIDGWKLKRNWYWSDESNRVLQKLLSLARRGSEIYYIAGNHDEFLRDFIEDFHLLAFGQIHLGREFVHETATGKTMLVTHGDDFDLVTKYAKWVAVLGDKMYEILIRANTFVNWLRRLFRFNKYWSMSKAVKHNVKKAVSYISDYEKYLVAYAKEKHCDGCVCGHIHTANIETIDGLLYCNTGDWVESCTAILEDFDGNFHLYHHEHI